MKFLFVVPSISKGGAERVVTVLANELIKQKYEATILYYFSTDNEYYVDSSVKLINLSESNEENYLKLGYLEKLKKLRKIIKSENPDFVIPFLSYVCAHTVAALIGTKYRIIQTIRNNPAVLPTNSKKRRLRDFLVKHSYKTIVQNEAQKQYFDKKIHKKLYVLPNPVREDLFEVKKQKQTNKFVIASAGRLSEQKNFKMLINAVNNICHENDNIILRIYGDGEQYHELESLIEKNQLENSVFLMGRTNDMKSMFSGIDLYILSSNFEGMPNSLMEAMAAGVPCISTDCPTGPSDIIENGKNGLLVPINDSSKMEKAIREILECDYIKIGENGRNFIKSNFSPKLIVKGLIEICQK